MLWDCRRQTSHALHGMSNIESMCSCWQQHQASRAVPVMQCLHTVHLLMQTHNDTSSSHAESSIPRPSALIAPALCSMCRHLPHPAEPADAVCMPQASSDALLLRRRVSEIGRGCQLPASPQPAAATLDRLPGTCRLPVRRHLTAPACPAGTCCLLGARHSPAAAPVRPFTAFESPRRSGEHCTGREGWS